jgi:hypothetical protein
MLQSDLCLISRHPVFREEKYEYTKTCLKQSESRLDNGVVSIHFSPTFFTGIGYVLEYIDQVLTIHSF